MSLINRLPKIKGTYTENVPLAPFTTIKVGGAADVFAEFSDWQDLSDFMRDKPDDIPFTILGAGSNALICDAGLSGVVTHLGKGFDDVSIDGLTLTAKAGATCGKAARTAREAGLGGLAFYAGIPGSIGGALRMNAGCYGIETYDVVSSIDLLLENGECKTVTPSDIPHSYRYTELPAGSLVTSATFTLQQGDKDEIKAAMRKINRERAESQPLGMPSSGSWFRNPTVNGKKLSAWKVTDDAGCRGLTVGGAQVSEKHTNFFVNLGNATAEDFKELSRQVEAKILETQGITMHREVRYLS